MALTMSYASMYIVLFVLTWVHFVGSTVLFLRWRKIFPIVGRETWLVFSMGVATLLWCSTDTLVGVVGPMSCALQLCTVYLALIWLQNVYLARTWRVWFLHFTACEQLSRRRNSISRSQAPAVYKYARLNHDHNRGPSKSKSEYDAYDAHSRRESLSSLEALSVSSPRSAASTDSPRPMQPSVGGGMRPTHAHAVSVGGGGSGSVGHHHRPMQPSGGGSIGHHHGRKALSQSMPAMNIERPRSTSPEAAGGGDRSGYHTPRSRSMASSPRSPVAASYELNSASPNHSRKSTPFQMSQQQRPASLKRQQHHQQHHHHHQQQKKRKHRRDGPSTPQWLKRRSTWFVDHKYLVKQRNMVKFCVAVTAAEWVAPIATFALAARSPDFVASAVACPSLSLSLWFLTGYVGLTVFFSLYTAYHLRSIRDGYGIKRELILVALTGILALVVANVLPGDEGSILSEVQRASYVVACNLLFFYSFTSPVIQAHHTRQQLAMYEAVPSGPPSRDDEAEAGKEESKSVGAYSTTLAGVMSNPDEFQEFMEHLKREWSTENMLFYLECRRFMDRCRQSGGWRSVEERNFRAAKIYADYLSPDSPLEVNLPANMKGPIHEHILECVPNFDVEQFRAKSRSLSEFGCVKPVASDTFKSASTKVYKLMQQDSFVRFIENQARKHRSAMLKRSSTSSRGSGHSSGHGKAAAGGNRQSSHSRRHRSPRSRPMSPPSAPRATVAATENLYIERPITPVHIPSADELDNLEACRMQVFPHGNFQSPSASVRVGVPV